MARKQTTKRRLGFQQLETRECMAGDVHATYVGGTLTLTGDGADNRLSVAWNGSGYVVAGIGTTINHSNQPFTSGPITRDLIIDLGGGNDYLVLANINAGRNVAVR